MRGGATDHSTTSPSPLPGPSASANAAWSSDQVPPGGCSTDAAADTATSVLPPRAVGSYGRTLRRCAALALLAIMLIIVGMVLVARADAAPISYDLQYRSRAIHWHHVVERQRVILVRHTRVLELPAPRPVPRAADFVSIETTSTAVTSWKAYGDASKRRAVYWRDVRIPRLHHRMTHPGGHGGARWKPLALYVGWTRAEWPVVLYIMAQRGPSGTGESGGDPHIVNPKSRCAGLMQIHPGYYLGVWSINGRRHAFNPLNPEANLRAAEGIHDTEEFRPWALRR